MVHIAHACRAALACAIAACAWFAQAGAQPQVLTLEDALSRARSQHPSLRAADFDLAAARARAEAAGRAENPLLSASIENVGGDLEHREESALFLEQPFALGGDRGARRGVGEAGAALGAAERAELQSELEIEVRERFVDAWAGQERLSRLRSAEELAARGVQIAAERHKAGAAPAFERARAEGLQSLRAIERRRAEAEHAAGLRRLTAMWPGDEHFAFDSLALAEPASRSTPPLDSLRARLAGHPRSRRAAAEVELRSWRAREARAARVPDLALGAGVRHLAEVDGTGFEFAVSLPLPLWNGGGAEVAASDAEVSAARERVRRTGVALDAELEATYLRYVAALEARDAVRDRLVPTTRETLRLVAEGYRAGRLGSLEIQEGQRSALEAELLLIDATADVWRAQGALEALTDTRLTPGAR